MLVSYSVAAANERKAAAQNAKNAVKAAEKAAVEDADWAKGSKGNKKEAEEQKRVRSCHFSRRKTEAYGCDHRD